ncbi:hypothetical protein [Blastococcus mobilis]|uniref:Uncharacterized protein n=1 Tax=Blastococcus mobilis TaxID=1938746 RepID=A0A238VF65_9ACTN|nr:hypothetical protein [Blastococcus mobilis]SNR32896.1 hypothetical protein SAMN06272737_10365 [Blastococcus mobilis]
MSAGAQVWLAALTILTLAALGIALYAVYAPREQLDRVDDTADQALALGQSIAEHLTGTEPESTGRHADGQPAIYRAPIHYEP